MQQLTLPLIGMMFLIGCSPVTSDTCPTLFSYSDEFQAKAAGEMDALPEGSALAKLVGDYGVVRAETRVCRGG